MSATTSVLIRSSIAASLLAMQAHGAILASYEFTGTSLDATTAHPDLIASALAVGVDGTELGVFANNQGHGISGGTVIANTSPASASAPTFYVVGTNTTTTAAGSVTANDFVHFTINVANGLQGTLSSLTFDYTTNGNTSGTNTSTFFLRSSVDGYTNDIGSSASVSYFSNNLLNNPYLRHTVDLSSFSPVEDDITFRLYIYQTGGTGNVTRFDNLTLNGDVIPEPATCVLAGLGLFAALGRRRRA